MIQCKICKGAIDELSLGNHICEFRLNTGHIHFNWFELEKKDDGIIIVCPEGCRRWIKKNGEVLRYDKEKELWV